MLFNIYYINFSKAYEIKMMLDNNQPITKEVSTKKQEQEEVGIRANASFNFMNIFKGGVSGDNKAIGVDAQKVIETFEVKTTKSIILEDVVNKCMDINSIQGNIKEGELIQINNVSLSLENEVELRTIKLFNSGAFKDLAIPGANGLDFQNLLNSMFKDYAYKIKGSTDGLEDDILIKIPLSFENEFESSYGIDDLFIGKVSIVGIYKGKIKIDKLKNSFEFFQGIGNANKFINTVRNSEDDEIQDSQYPRDSKSTTNFRSSGNSNEFHYIDLIAIIQNIENDTK